MYVLDCYDSGVRRLTACRNPIVYREKNGLNTRTV